MTNERGTKQWAHFKAELQHLQPSCLEGPILDLGSGRGETVLAGLGDDIDIWGIETQQHRLDHFHTALEETNSPADWQNRCAVYDGHILPYDNEHFSAVVSWYVLEHIPNLEQVLRETARTLQSGAPLYFRAQDARVAYEGHAKIPWLPFMPKPYVKPWLEEFGKLKKFDYLENYVFDCTMPQIASILESCGCEIVEVSPNPPQTIPNHWQVSSETELRTLARTVKAQWDNGTFPQHPEPFVKARKI